MGSPDRSLEDEVQRVARRIAELGSDQTSRVYRMSWWSDRLIDWAMRHPEFKTQLFRLVDVYPAMIDDRDVARHVEEYFEGIDTPRVLEAGMSAAGHVPFGRSIEAAVARRNILRMARQFIVGSTVDEAVDGLHRLWRDGSAATIDLLGEKTVTSSQADRYAGRVHELLDTLLTAAPSWAPDDHLERDDLGPIARVNVSVKPTALAAHYEPLTREQGIASAKARLRPLLRLARDGGGFIHFDMEHYEVKDLTLTLFRELLSEDEFTSCEAGIVIQAYLRDSHRDLADLVAWSVTRPVPITVRLVKGAYWDTETVLAQQAGWPVPVYEHKGHTDANFDRCARLLHDHHGSVKAAFGSHNLRSLAYAVAYARSLGIPDHGYELQMLYGMAEPMHLAVKRLGLRLRVYAPMGELLPGMAYLVRRLLENTSNESFVRHRFAEGAELDSLLAPPPVDDDLPPPPAPVRRPATDPAAPQPFVNEPVAELRQAPVRAALTVAVSQVESDLADAPLPVPAFIAGHEVTTSRTITSVDPARPDRAVAISACCGAAEADAAVAAAVAAAEQWAATPARDRAAVLFGAAEWMRARRDRIAAVEMFEAGKPWAEADADVCEAIDFCEYYARQMLRLTEGGDVHSPPGEDNRLHYTGKGVAVVIPPWNFPLAIPCGMTSAALVAGNPVILKPAEQTPGVAHQLAQALRAGGAPDGVFQIVPGVGEEVGVHLVDHPDVALIAFTGSMAVGLEIVRRAAVHQPGQRHVKRVLAEMGGKNALIIDHDADIDQAVPAAAYSAFGYAGQKCSAASRLIIHEAVHDEVVRRLVEVGRELAIGHPSCPETQMGPVIEEEARDRVVRYTEMARRDGRVVLERADLPAAGWFVSPVVVTDLPTSSPVAREEIFGPVLSVFRATGVDEAIAIANDTDFALTAGIFSRSPRTIERAAHELRAGNVYVNRSITGAVVGRQPFGGFGLSGVGAKAGGPDYLLQFTEPRAVTENTLRQGFAPEPTP